MWIHVISTNKQPAAINTESRDGALCLAPSFEQDACTLECHLVIGHWHCNSAFAQAKGLREATTDSMADNDEVSSLHVGKHDGRCCTESVFRPAGQ